MGAASLMGVPVMRVGTNPWPVKRKTTSWSLPRGIGRKNPVSVLLTASVSPVASSYRNTLETPVRYEVP